MIKFKKSFLIHFIFFGLIQQSLGMGLNVTTAVTAKALSKLSGDVVPEDLTSGIIKGAAFVIKVPQLTGSDYFMQGLRVIQMAPGHFPWARNSIANAQNNSTDSIKAVQALERINPNIRRQISDQLIQAHNTIHAALDGNPFAQLKLADLKFNLNGIDISQLSKDQLTKIQSALDILNDQFEPYKHELLKEFSSAGSVKGPKDCDIEKCARIYTRWIAEVSINDESFHDALKWRADNNIPGFKRVYHVNYQEFIAGRLGRSIGQFIYHLGKDAKDGVVKWHDPDVTQKLIRTIQTNPFNQTLQLVQNDLQQGKLFDAIQKVENFKGSAEQLSMLRGLYQRVLSQMPLLQICNQHPEIQVVQEIKREIGTRFITDPYATVEYLHTKLSNSPEAAQAYPLFFDKTGYPTFYNVTSTVKDFALDVSSSAVLEQRILISKFLIAANDATVRAHALTGLYYVHNAIEEGAQGPSIYLATAVHDELFKRSKTLILNCPHLIQLMEGYTDLHNYVLHAAVELHASAIHGSVNARAALLDLDKKWGEVVAGNTESLQWFQENCGFKTLDAVPGDLGLQVEIVKTNHETHRDRIVKDAVARTRTQFQTVPADAKAHDAGIIDAALSEYRGRTRNLNTTFCISDTDQLRDQKLQDHYDVASYIFSKASNQIKDPASQAALYDALDNAVQGEYRKVYKSFPEMVVERIKYNGNNAGEFLGASVHGALKLAETAANLSGGDESVGALVTGRSEQMQVTKELSDQFTAFTKWYNSLSSQERNQFLAHLSGDIITGIILDRGLGAAGVWSALGKTPLGKLKLFPNHGGLSGVVKQSLQEVWHDLKYLKDIPLGVEGTAMDIGLQADTVGAKAAGVGSAEASGVKVVEEIGQTRNKIPSIEKPVVTVGKNADELLQNLLQYDFVNICPEINQEIIREAAELLKDVPGALAKDGPFKHFFDLIMNPERISITNLRGSYYELECAVKLIRQGEDIVGLGQKFKCSTAGAQIDIITKNAFIECKNIHWFENMDISGLQYQFSKGQQVAQAHSKIYEIFFKHSPPEKLAAWLQENNIKFRVL